MMHPFMTLDDETEIVHSDSYLENGKEVVKVYMERPTEGGFDSAVCYLPDYRWEDIKGFSELDIARLEKLIASLSHIIIQLAREGGFERAANF